MILGAKHILNVLAEKHRKDIFVPECKDGPTQSVSEYSRMDAWVMNRSWAHPCYTAYEIKVTRSDFLSDKKWRNYLPYCNEFFFVAPKGLIRPDELPAEAGLLELLGGSQTGKRLVKRKQAVWRDVIPPESLFRYVLMCRVVVARNDYQRDRTEVERSEQWREFIKARVEDRALGYEVAEAIREKVKHVEKENERLTKRMSEYDSVRSFLSHLGIDPNGYVSSWDTQRRLEEMEKAFPPEFLQAMHSLKYSLDRALERADVVQNGNNKDEAAA